MIFKLISIINNKKIINNKFSVYRSWRSKVIVRLSVLTRRIPPSWSQFSTWKSCTWATWQNRSGSGRNLPSSSRIGKISAGRPVGKMPEHMSTRKRGKNRKRGGKNGKRPWPQRQKPSCSPNSTPEYRKFLELRLTEWLFIERKPIWIEFQRENYFFLECLFSIFSICFRAEDHSKMQRLRTKCQKRLFNEKNGSQTKQLESEVEQWQTEITNQTRLIDHELQIKTEQVNSDPFPNQFPNRIPNFAKSISLNNFEINF